MSRVAVYQHCTCVIHTGLELDSIGINQTLSATDVLEVDALHRVSPSYWQLHASFDQAGVQSLLGPGCRGACDQCVRQGCSSPSSPD